MAQRDTVDTSKLTLTFILGVILTASLVIAVQALYFWGQRREWERKELSPRPTAVGILLERQRAALRERAVLEKGPDGRPVRVRVPIDVAMRLVVEEASGRASAQKESR